MIQQATQVTEFFWLILISFVVALLARRLRIPYALGLVITGLAIGIPRLLPQAHLDPTILLTVFLPPMLFESALHLRIGALRRDWMPIAIFTLAGTVASTFIVGGLTAWGLRIPIAPALVFGALISTTDPISVIAIFKRLGAGRRLTLIIEAESLFNNDTAVVLFAVMMTAAAGGKVSLSAGMLQFARLVVGGALLGGGIGWTASRIHDALDDPLVEITLTSVVAFGAYLGAEALHVSGVMAVVVAGLVVGNYGMPTSMSAGTRLAVSAFWEYAAFVVNSIVFLLIGIEVAYVRWADKIGYAAAAVVVVLVGRSAIYPLAWIAHRLGADIPRAWRHVLFWGGLRGALSMALALGLDRSFPARETLIAGAFGVVLFSLLVQGMTVGVLLKRLGLTGESERKPPDRRLLEAEQAACRAALAELETFRSGEAHPDWAIEMLVKEYDARILRLEAEMQDPKRAPRPRELPAAAAARKAALTAEKSSLREAERQGNLEPEDWIRIRRRLDAEILALSVRASGNNDAYGDANNDANQDINEDANGR